MQPLGFQLKIVLHVAIVKKIILCEILADLKKINIHAIFGFLKATQCLLYWTQKVQHKNF